MWISLALTACAHKEPPTPGGTPWSAAPEVAAVPSAPSTPLDAGEPRPGTSPALPASASAPQDPSILPQTRDVPAANGAAFDARVAALWDAIVRDDPEAGMPFFFPLGAYRQVKDVGDPAGDWKHRLVSAYARDIHVLHARLGQGAPRARLVALDVPHGSARWVEPGEEWNKLGYFRVFGSKLRFEVEGAADAFDVKSLIAWRGEWYVVHLSAIR